MEPTAMFRNLSQEDWAIMAVAFLLVLLLLSFQKRCKVDGENS